MERDRDESLRAVQLAFVGRVVASFTHELKNHLAIVKESAGLQQDLITFGGAKAKVDPKELLKFLKSVDEEVQRTLTFVSFLNRYAHRMDAEMSVFSVNEVLDELIALTERLARQRRITVQKDFDETLPALCSNPSRLQLVVFGLFEKMYKTLEQRSQIVMKTRLAQEGMTVSLIPQGAAVEPESDTAWLCTEEFAAAVVTDLGGTITKEETAGAVTISLPLSGGPRTS
ncbi:MAG: hypothetical protein ACM3ON_02330 [Chloroflexota bacterium]